jgi:putative SOS response-associated peptidase YedK
VLPAPKRRLLHGEWGLPLGAGARCAINARAETLEARERFRDCLPARRCLVPADGFYEWPRGTARGKSPRLFQLRDGGLFAMAGLWEPRRGVCGGWAASFCVVTVPANSLVAELHERMPAILRAEDEDAWLGAPTAEEALAVLRPFPARELRARAVHPAVNDVRREGSACWDEPPQGELFAS